MPVISAENLSKVFRVQQKEPGLVGAVKAPFKPHHKEQKMRAELAATLIHEPEIVYLDEPTIGLDLLVKERIRAFIKEQNGRKGRRLF